eukprot:5275870-Pyramimonas_sp.AAC.1
MAPSRRPSRAGGGRGATACSGQALVASLFVSPRCMMSDAARTHLACSLSLSLYLSLPISQ